MIFSNLINRHEDCVGITLWKFGQTNIELWYCPAGYEIQPHSHPKEHIELMFIAGKATFYRIKNMTQSFTPRWYHMFRRFTVTPGRVHWFSVSHRALIFINIARFIDGHKPTSAAVDFEQF